MGIPAELVVAEVLEEVVDRQVPVVLGTRVDIHPQKEKMAGIHQVHFLPGMVRGAEAEEVVVHLPLVVSVVMVVAVLVGMEQHHRCRDHL